MSDSRRLQRVQKELRSLIGTYLLTRFDRLPHKFFTVNHVTVSGDLQHAKVFVGAFGGHPTKDIVSALNRHVREIQSYVGRELPMRYCPKLNFLPDETTETILHVEKVLNDIKTDRSADPAGPRI